MTHFVVWVGGQVMGFFAGREEADTVAGLIGGTAEELEGPMPSNDELGGKGGELIELRPVSFLGIKRASGTYRGV